VPLGTALYKLAYRSARQGTAAGADAGADSPGLVDRPPVRRMLAAKNNTSDQLAPSNGSHAAVEAPLYSTVEAAKPLPSDRRMAAEIVATTNRTSQAVAGASMQDARDEHLFVLFLGQPATLLHMLDLTDYSPRLIALPVSLPAILQQLSFWIFSVSAAIALVNSLPVFFLDGAAALTAALDMRTIDLPAAIALPLAPRSLCSSPTLRRNIKHRVLWFWSAMFGFVVVTQVLRVCL